MSMRDMCEKMTICETLRQLNDLIQEDTEEHNTFRDFIATAEYLAKRMSVKLHEYSAEGDSAWLVKNKRYEEILSRNDAGYKVGKVLNEVRAEHGNT